MSHRPGYYRDYYTANRARILARQKAWRDANIEHCRAVEAAWRKAHPESVAAKQRRCRQKPQSKMRDAAEHRAKRKAHTEKVRAADRAYYAKAVGRKRVQARVSHAKAMLSKGKMYHANYHARLPEWAPVGGVVDARSQWLACNLTDSQRAYARELAIERKERRAAR